MGIFSDRKLQESIGYCKTSRPEKVGERKIVTTGCYIIIRWIEMMWMELWAKAFRGIGYCKTSTVEKGGWQKNTG